MINNNCSFIIPVLNESVSSVKQTLSSIIRYNKKAASTNWEVVLVCKKSPPQIQKNFSDALKTLFTQHPQIKMIFCSNPELGKGGLLKTGFQFTQNPWIICLDAGLPFDLNFVKNATCFSRLGYEFIVANRRLDQSFFRVPVHLLPLVYRRHRLGLLFNWVCRKTFGIQVTDTQAGIKILSRSFAQIAFELQKETGPLFEVEHFLIAREYAIKQIDLPVQFLLKEEKSSLSLSRELISTILGLARIAKSWLRNSYTPGKERFRSRIRQAYTHATFRDKLYLSLRSRLCPYSKIAALAPLGSKVLDLACGYGLLGQAILARDAQTHLLGIDQDPHRVHLAELAARKTLSKNTEWQVGDMRSMDVSSYSAIFAIDALHYLSPSDQNSLLEKISAQISPSGVFIFREIDPTRGLFFQLTRLYEKIALLTRWTKSARGSNISIRTPAQWQELLENHGFEVSHFPLSYLGLADELFFAKKRDFKTEKASQENAKLLLSNSTIAADDWGISPAVNQGILLLAKKGVIKKVSVLSQAPFADHLLYELTAIPDLKIALHFDLTFKGKTKSTGYKLLALMLPFFRKKILENAKKTLIDQTAALRKLGITPHYLDSHHHVHVFPGIAKSIATLAYQLGYRMIRIPESKGNAVGLKRQLLNYLSRQSLPFYQSAGFGWTEFFYPDIKHTDSIDQIARLFISHRDVEILVHPASRDDFDQINCSDTMRAERVYEYALLNSLMQSELKKNEHNLSAS